MGGASVDLRPPSRVSRRETPPRTDRRSKAPQAAEADDKEVPVPIRGTVFNPPPLKGLTSAGHFLLGLEPIPDAIGTRSPLPDSPSQQLCPDLVSVHGNVSFSPLASPPCTPTRLPAIYGANLQPRHYSSCTGRVGGRFRRSTPSIKPPAGPNQLG